MSRVDAGDEESALGTFGGTVTLSYRGQPSWEVATMGWSTNVLEEIMGWRR